MEMKQNDEFQVKKKRNKKESSEFLITSHFSSSSNKIRIEALILHKKKYQKREKMCLGPPRGVMHEKTSFQVKIKKKKKKRPKDLLFSLASKNYIT